MARMKKSTGDLRRSTRLAGATAPVAMPSPSSSPSPVSRKGGPSPSPGRRSEDPSPSLAPSPGSREMVSPTRAADGASAATPAASPASSPMIEPGKRVQVDMNRYILLEKLLIATKEKFEAMILYEREKGRLMLEQYKLSEYQKLIEDEETHIERNGDEWTVLEEINIEIEKARIDLEHSVRQRKRLHEKILDLKGNVRVFCRLCPFDPLKANKGEAFTAKDGDDPIIELPAKDKLMIFDKIFKDNATQEAIFEEVSPLVQSAIDGNQVCIFAYGQTGSGKTYTMIGSSDVNNERSGIVPRLVRFILKAKKKIKVSVIEFYNDQLRDLLNANVCGRDLQICRDKKDLPYVSGITNRAVTSEMQLPDLLEEIMCRRSIGETKMNKASSRSHCMFQFVICDEDDKDVGGIAVIDLAGSERLKKTEADGDRKTEAKYISKSLSLLRRILTAISNKEKGHLPFRDSKLTHVLERYLRGGTKVIMIATLAQQESEEAQSLSTLEFAESVKCCNLMEMMSPASRFRSVRSMQRD